MMALLCVACQTPTQRAERFARQASFTREVVQGSVYHHLVYRNPRTGPADVLHVYLDGDGSPYWRGGNQVAFDPTPRNPLALHLMAQDQVPPVWIGRPCYFEVRDPRCDAGAWTTGRYAQDIVDSIASVLRQELARGPATRAVLIGYSGGAALAILVATQVPAVDRVITVAGNLDTDAWTTLHGYTPLHGSLNPVRVPGRALAMVHFAGAIDRNIPPALIQAAAAVLGGTVVVEPGFDHTCCWAGIWSDVLRRSGGP